MSPESRHHGPGRYAIGLLEVLIALTLGTVLLAALALAVSSALQATTVNGTQATLTVQGRRALVNMLNQIRLYGAAPHPDNYNGNYGSASISATEFQVPYVPQTGGSPVNYIYKWDQTSGTLNMKAGETGTWNVLLRGVSGTSAVVFTLYPGKSDPSATNYDVIQRVTISLTVTGQGTGQSVSYSSSNAASSSTTLSGSAAPRQYTWNAEKLACPISNMQLLP